MGERLMDAEFSREHLSFLAHLCDRRLIVVGKSQARLNVYIMTGIELGAKCLRIVRNSQSRAPLRLWRLNLGGLPEGLAHPSQRDEEQEIEIVFQGMLHKSLPIKDIRCS